MATQSDIEKLHAENIRLTQLLENHGIEWRLPEKIEVEPETIRFVEVEPSLISTIEKVNIFRKLFYWRLES